ncbi:MAG: chorismate synthase [Candidatus Zixiibacteriota bacterium]
MIRYSTAGESHGPGLTTIIEGIPAGLKLDINAITIDLRRRQMGYGRGARMRIEQDTALVTAGLWEGETIGSPISIFVQNRDWQNWKDKRREKKVIPRPGHADLPALLKYDFDDIQKAIERSSARETAARAAAGNIAKQYLGAFGIKVYSHTRRIGAVFNEKPVKFSDAKFREIEKSPVRCGDKATEREMIRAIDNAVEQADTLGGVSEIVIIGAPVGLGSYAQWDRRLDTRLAAVIMGVQSVKGVEIGEGFRAAELSGSKVHDPISHSAKKGYFQTTNNAGGIAGGISTGEEIVVRAYFKPISTLGRPLKSTNISTKKATDAPYVRSDICVVPAGGVVCEAVAAIAIADAMSEKFGGDSMREAKENFKSYLKHVRKR